MKKSINSKLKNTLFYFNIGTFLCMIIIFILKKYIISLISPIMLSFWMLITFIFILLFGYKKNKSSNLKIRIIQTFLSFSITYLIIIYLFGFISGFIKNYWSLTKFASFFYLVSTIIVEELIRFLLLNKNPNDKKQITITAILFLLCDVFIKSSYIIGNSLDYTILSLIMISFIKNLFLTYTSLKYGYIPCYIYRILIDIIPVYIFIFPNIGAYLNVIFLTIFTSILYYFISKPYRKREMETANTYKKSGMFYVECIMIVSAIILVVLVSNNFKYTLSSIASDSMYPALKRGDAILLKKLNDTEKDALEIGDIIAFQEDNIIVTHRIIDIEEKEKTYYITQGDNNNAKDVTKKTKDDIIGIVKFRIPLLGYPSIEISEIKNK